MNHTFFKCHLIRILQHNYKILKSILVCSKYNAKQISKYQIFNALQSHSINSIKGTIEGLTKTLRYKQSRNCFLGFQKWNLEKY